MHALRTCPLLEFVTAYCPPGQNEYAIEESALDEPLHEVWATVNPLEHCAHAFVPAADEYLPTSHIKQ